MKLLIGTPQKPKLKKYMESIHCVVSLVGLPCGCFPQPGWYGWKFFSIYDVE